jgi:hypothetical protein
MNRRYRSDRKKESSVPDIPALKALSKVTLSFFKRKRFFFKKLFSIYFGKKK